MIFRITFMLAVLLGSSLPSAAQDVALPETAVTIEQMDLQTVLLMPGETIFMDVYRVPDMNGHYEIDLEGYVLLPLLGKIAIKDQTPSEFAKTLMVLYEKDYLVDPFIQVSRADFPKPNITSDVSTIDVPELPEDFTIENSTVVDDFVMESELEESKLRGAEPVGTSTEAETFLDTETLPSVKATQPEVIIFDQAIVYAEDTDASITQSDIQSNIEETIYEPEEYNLETVELLEGTQWYVEGGGQQIIQFLTNGNLKGIGVCNNIFADYVQENSKLKVQFRAITINDCPDVFKGDDSFIEALENTRSFTISPQNVLRLLDKDKITLLTMNRRG